LVFLGYDRGITIRSLEIECQALPASQIHPKYEQKRAVGQYEKEFMQVRENVCNSSTVENILKL
jgi:hypothetical protein